MSGTVMAATAVKILRGGAVTIVIAVARRRRVDRRWCVVGCRQRLRQCRRCGRLRRRADDVVQWNRHDLDSGLMRCLFGSVGGAQPDRQEVTVKGSRASFRFTEFYQHWKSGGGGWPAASDFPA